MKIKQNQQLKEANLNQMQTQTVVKTGDTTFVDGLKDLDMANSMKKNLEVTDSDKNSIENKSESKEEKASKNINDFCNSNINYVSKADLEKKSADKSNIIDKKTDTQDSIKNNQSQDVIPKMVIEEFIPEEKAVNTPKASMEEFEFFEKSNNQFLALEKTIQTINELPKNNKNEIKSENKIDNQFVKNNKDLKTEEEQSFDIKPIENMENILNKNQEINNVEKGLEQNQIGKHDEVKLSVEDFKPEDVKEQLKPQIDGLNSFNNVSNIISNEYSEDISNVSTNKSLKVEKTNNNNVLDKILNDDVNTLVDKVPVMEQVVPKELRQFENSINKTLDMNNNVQDVNNVEKGLKQNQFVKNNKDLKTEKEQAFDVKSTTLARTAIEPEKKQPLENLNKFLNEIMSEDTVENLKSKDVSMIDDNTLLTEEIKNYYNLNRAQNLAMTEDVKNVINERIAEINDLASIVETAQETKSIRKDLKSLDVQKAQSKKIETKQLKMTEQDANFFIDLVKNNQDTAQTVEKTVNQIMQDLQQADETQQTTRVSKALADMIGEAAKTNKPFRIDFDKNISVIIKIDREGKISAEFLPGDKAVEQYLRTQLPMLRQKFNDENIDYKDLNYRQSNGGRQNRERRRRGE